MDELDEPRLARRPRFRENVLQVGLDRVPLDPKRERRFGRVPARAKMLQRSRLRRRQAVAFGDAREDFEPAAFDHCDKDRQDAAASVASAVSKKADGGQGRPIRRHADGEANVKTAVSRFGRSPQHAMQSRGAIPSLSSQVAVRRRDGPARIHHVLRRSIGVNDLPIG